MGASEGSLLEGRVALVTGGTGGLGAAIARRFAAHGASGSVVDVAEGPVPDGWASLVADVTDEEQMARAVADTVARYGRLDVVVANAGIVPPWSVIDELDVEAYDRTLHVNGRGVAVTVKHGARAMRDAGRGGAVVVMASLNSWHAAPSQTAYTASKHAALGITRTAALDLGAYGIRVNAIGPGPVLTGALRQRLENRAAGGGLPVDVAIAEAGRLTALGRMVTEDEVATTALFLASDLSSGITGQLIPVDGGMR